MNLHRGVSKSKHTCFEKTMPEKIACYVRTRTYLLVYVCDHHFSIAYGRAPMTREFTSLIAPSAYLEMEHANTPDDFCLVAQVELWTILSRVFDTFGVNTDMAIPTEKMVDFRRFNIALESWRIDTNEKITSDADTKSIDVTLHSYFAKLYLYTHAFRGVTITSAVPHDMEEFADSAVYTAQSLLRWLASSPDLQSHLRGLPTYFATMVAASIVFLLKMAIKRPNNVRVDKDDTSSLLRQVAGVLADITKTMHSQHVLSQISMSVSKLVASATTATSCDVPGSPNRTQNTSTATQQQEADQSTIFSNDDMAWLQDGDFGIDWFEFDQALHNT